MRIVLRIEGAGFQIDRFRQKNFVPRCEGAIYFTILKPIFCPDRDQDVSIDTYEIIFGPTKGKVFEKTEGTSRKTLILVCLKYRTAFDVLEPCE